MKKGLCLLILCIACISLFGQTPGYVGKKNVLSVSVSTLPAIRYMNQDESNQLVFNLRTELLLEHVISRQHALELPFAYLQTRTPYSFQGREGIAQLSFYSAGATFKRYSFKGIGNIAPLGGYLQAKMYYAYTEIEDLDRQFYPDQRTDLGNYQGIGIEGGIGFQRIFGRIFTLQTGLRIGTVLGIDNSEKTVGEAEIADLVSTRLQGHLLFNLQFGLGILL